MRRMRSGSSVKVWRGSSGVRAIYSWRSRRPRPVKSSTWRVLMLKKSELIVRSLLKASSLGVPI